MQPLSEPLWGRVPTLKHFTYMFGIGLVQTVYLRNHKFLLYEKFR